MELVPTVPYSYPHPSMFDASRMEQATVQYTVLYCRSRCPFAQADAQQAGACIRPGVTL